MSSSTSSTKDVTNDASKFGKLNLLLNQASLYSGFLIKKMPAQYKHLQEVVVDVEKEDQQVSSTSPDTPTKARSNKRQKLVESETKNVVSAEDVHKLLAPGITLRPYQVVGVEWLLNLYSNGLHGILADEMGLGKTIQVISFLRFLINQNTHGPFLIVAPLSTLHNWVAEFKRFTPTIRTQLYHGNSEERSNLRFQWPAKNDGPDFPVIITSYEIAMNDTAHLAKMHWKALVVDEGHRLKNLECKLIKVLKGFASNIRLLLTGTPLQNNLKELWSLLNFLLPDIFDSLERFESWFEFDRASSLDAQAPMIIEQEVQHQLISKLHDILRPFVLRRVKREVLKGLLPDKREYVLYCPLTPQQRQYYQILLDGKGKEFFGPTAVGSNTLKNMLMQLRKVCNHPFLLREPEGEHGTDERIVTWCSKMKLLDVMLKRLKEKNHKVLIFSQMTSFLTILEDYLTLRHYSYCRIDGSVEMATRQQQILEFNSDHSNIFVFLLSTRAGGLGINLASADTVIIYDSDWNPHADDQAQDRCHRIGQTKPVHVYRFITPNSVEVSMLKRANSKRKLDQMVIAKGKFDHSGIREKSITEELLDLFNLNETKLDPNTGGPCEPLFPLGESPETKTAAPIPPPASSSLSPSVVSPYEDGVLDEHTLDLLMDRTAPVPTADGVEKGFHVVKNNSSFADLF